MSCMSPALAVAISMAFLALILAIVSLAMMIVRARSAAPQPDDHLQFAPGMVLSPAATEPPRARMRAGPSPAPQAPDPTLTLCRRSSIEQEARAAARADHITTGRRRANPYRMQSAEYRCWAVAYSDEWEAPPAQSLDASDEGEPTVLQRVGVGPWRRLDTLPHQSNLANTQ